ncbi:MAG TPA: ABC transporter permease [Vicinamibacterales bacterium]
MVETLFSDIRYALRWLRRSPGFTLVAIVSLAIGIGFNTALFTLIDAVLFRPLPISRADRVSDVYTTSPDDEGVYATSSYPDYLDLKAQNHVFSDMIGYSPIILAVSGGDRSRMALGEVVTGNYFQMLGLKPHIGRLLTAEDDRPDAPRAVVLSYAAWVRDHGASPSAVGQSMRIHGHVYTIVGVAPRNYIGMVPMLSASLWIPTAFVDDGEPGGIISIVPSPTGNTRLERRGTRWMFVKGRLKDGVSPAQAQADLQVIGQQLATAYPQTNKNRRVTVINGVHIHPDADRMLLPIGLALMVVVGLVLLVACANVASMLLARASGRQKEIGIRLALGASRGRLTAQLLTESGVVAALGALAGVGLAWALTQLALSITLPIPIPLTFALRIDSRVLAFTIVVTLLAALVAGLAPALKATRPNLVNELKGDAAPTLGNRRWTLRDALVVAQISVTMVLLVAAGLLTRSLAAAERIGLGFEPKGLAIISTELGLIGYDDNKSEKLYERAMERVRAIPGVEAAAIVERTPFSINYNRNNLFIPGVNQPGDPKGFAVDATRVAPEYFGTLGVPIVQGRNFAATDTRTSPNVAIVNESFARRFWPNESAIGKVFHNRSLDGPQFEIVGICADYKVSTPGEAPTPYVHYAYSQNPTPGEAILARTRGNADQLLSAMRRELLALDPNIVFLDSQTMRMQVDATLMPARLGAMGVGGVGIVAMALAAIGLYGVIAYSVSRRTREIGVRMALGANRGSVVALVMKQGLALAVVGVAIGALLAAVGARAMASALYNIGAFDPITWIGAMITLFCVAALANAVPARRAAVVDPSVALRSE